MTALNEDKSVTKKENEEKVVNPPAKPVIQNEFLFEVTNGSLLLPR